MHALYMYRERRGNLMPGTAILFQDLKELIDPSKNMSKYRSYVGSDHVQPPMV
jgi:hypothetical protein